MTRRILTLAFLLLAAAHPALAVDLARPEPGSLVPGRTTMADALAKFGEPTSRSKKPGPSSHDIEEVTFLYAPYGTNGRLIRGNYRRLALAFWDGKLISHTFVSSFMADNTNFDERKASSFTIGTSTRDDVLRNLGRPAGEAIYPPRLASGGSALFYSYISVTRSTDYSGNTVEASNKSVWYVFNAAGTLVRLDDKTSTVPNERN